MNESSSRLIQLAKKFNCFFLNSMKNVKGTSNNNLQSTLPFIVEGYQCGIIKQNVLKEMLNHPDIFLIFNNVVELNPIFAKFEKRSEMMAKLLEEWRQKDLFVALRGWRDECYEVKQNFNDTPLLKIERSASCLFGIRSYGIDINGFVNHPVKGLCLWFQKRSLTKQTWPGKLDNMVGGGIANGSSVSETALKELGEEAGIFGPLTEKLKPVGTVSFFYESPRGLHSNTEFVFDLELPIDFTPNNQDGEVESFILLTAKEALEIVLSPTFKTTSCPVTLDFFIRHGVITYDIEPELPQLIELLHVPLSTMYTYNYQVQSNNGNENNEN